MDSYPGKTHSIHFYPGSLSQKQDKQTLFSDFPDSASKKQGCDDDKIRYVTGVNHPTAHGLIMRMNAQVIQEKNRFSG